MSRHSRLIKTPKSFHFVRLDSLPDRRHIRVSCVLHALRRCCCEFLFAKFIVFIKVVDTFNGRTQNDVYVSCLWPGRIWRDEYAWRKFKFLTLMSNTRRELILERNAKARSVIYCLARWMVCFRMFQTRSKAHTAYWSIRKEMPSFIYTRPTKYLVCIIASYL